MCTLSTGQTHPKTHLATLADETCILSSDPKPKTDSRTLQDHISAIQTWCRRWLVRVNGAKSSHLTFTLRHQHCPPVLFKYIPIPTSSQVRYLGLHLDRQLTWTDLNRKFGALLSLLLFLYDAHSKHIIFLRALRKRFIFILLIILKLIEKFILKGFQIQRLCCDLIAFRCRGGAGVFFIIF